MSTSRIPQKMKLAIILFGCVVLATVISIYRQLTMNQSPAPEIEISNTQSIHDQTVAAETKKSAIPEIASNTVKSSTALHSKQDTDIIATTPTRLPGKPFAPSIENTEIDGQLKADSNGNLVIDLEVRDVFDYFLNTVADVPPEVAVGELDKLARTYLPESAAIQTMKLLGDYLQYKQAAIEMMDQPLLPRAEQTPEYQLSVMEDTFNKLKALRRQVMSPEAVDAFFALEEAYGDYTLTTLKIENNQNLSAEQKALEIATARENLPEQLRQTETRITQENQQGQKVVSLVSSDLSNQQLEIELEKQGLNEKQITDVLTYREDQENFNQVYQQYRTEYHALQRAGLSDTDWNQALDQLQQKYFQSEQWLTQARVKDLGQKNTSVN